MSKIDDFSNQIIICDNGSYSLKVGFAGEDLPKVVIPTTSGKQRKELAMMGSSQRLIYGGRFAVDNQGILDMTYPIKNSIITDWDAMEDVWFHMYYEQLLVVPKDYIVLHTEPVHNPISCREKLFEIMFEGFNVPKMVLINKSTLALYSCGKTSGLVVDSGFDTTQVVPIYEGYPISHAVRNMPVGGCHLTKFLKQMINLRGYNLTTQNDWERIKHIKKTFCYCAMDYEKELATFSKDKEQQYTLPDGMIVSINNEAIRCPEAMFNPTMLRGMELNKSGIHDMVHESIAECNVNERNGLYDNIVFSGGNTLFSGFPERLKTMIDTGSPGTEVRITARPEREFSTWIGGSMVASSSNFEHMWIDNAEYQEKGPNIVLYKSIV